MFKYLAICAVVLLVTGGVVGSKRVLWKLSAFSVVPDNLYSYHLSNPTTMLCLESETADSSQKGSERHFDPKRSPICLSRHCTNFASWNELFGSGDWFEKWQPVIIVSDKPFSALLILANVTFSAAPIPCTIAMFFQTPHYRKFIISKFKRIFKEQPSSSSEVIERSIAVLPRKAQVPQLTTTV